MHSTSSDESTISLGDLMSDPFSSLGSSAAFIISSIDISSTGFSGSRLWVRGAGCGFLAISFSISSTDIDSSGFSLKKKKKNDATMPSRVNTFLVYYFRRTKPS